MIGKQTSWGWAKPSSVSSLVSTRVRITASSKMDLNFPHGPQKNDILKKLDPLHVKSHQKKFHLKRLRNSRVMACNVISAQSIEKWPSSWLIKTLHCFVSILDYLHLKSDHAKFQLNPIRNVWVMVWLEILQRCMEYCSAAGSMFCI